VSKWESFTKAFLYSWAQVKCSFRKGYLIWPLRKPAAKKYDDLVESMMDAVIALISPGSRQHAADWDRVVKKLALKTCREARQIVEGILKGRFAEVEEEHLRKSLPGV
jgi:hypothetical protein